MTKQSSLIKEIDDELNSMRSLLLRELGHRPYCFCGVCPDEADQRMKWAIVDRLLEARFELVMRGN